MLHPDTAEAGPAPQRARVRRPLAPGLHVAATPIGNLGDASPRLAEAMAGADMVVCEDTRVTARLAQALGVAPRLLPYHDHNAEEQRPKVLAALAEGARVVLVSDAGTPLVSDPGFKLVRAAHEAGHRVAAVPGPSAVTAALSIAGLPTDRFLFDGFLPPKPGRRAARIAELAAIPATLVLFETGPRLAAALAALAAGLGPREAAVCRELTKLYEEVRRGPLDALAAAYAAAPEPKGEIVLVIAPPGAEADDRDDLDARLAAAVEAHGVKEAAARLAAETGLPKRDLYRRAVALAAALEAGGEDGDEP